MEFIDKNLEEYCLQHTSEESDLLKELDRETHVKILRPRMLSGHLQGKFLKWIVQIFKPLEILEIGTYTGYSALSMAEGMLPNACLHTIDINVELEEMIKRYIKKSGFEHQINLYIGDAQEIIPTMNRKFDLVFIDADKENYLKYYNMVLPKMNQGGIILADNVLWSGKVLNEPKSNDYETKAIIEFNEFVKNDNRVEKLLLPVRDGILIMRVL